MTPYVDLESCFDRDGIDLVFQADAIHSSGGNTFQFYYWIIQRGLKPRLLDYAKSGKVLIGVSAGAIVMTPDLSYAQFCGDRNEVDLPELRGLGLVDFCFVPHAEGDFVAQNIVAWRLLWLTYQARENPCLPCDTILETHEWQSLYCHFHGFPLTKDPPSIKQAVIWIAQLGGFLARRHDAFPGVKTLWRGLQRLNDIASTWKLLHSSQNQDSQTYG